MWTWSRHSQLVDHLTSAQYSPLGRRRRLLCSAGERKTHGTQGHIARVAGARTDGALHVNKQCGRFASFNYQDTSGVSGKRLLEIRGYARYGRVRGYKSGIPGKLTLKTPGHAGYTGYVTVIHTQVYRVCWTCLGIAPSKYYSCPVSPPTCRTLEICNNRT